MSMCHSVAGHCDFTHDTPRASYPTSSNGTIYVTVLRTTNFIIDSRLGTKMQYYNETEAATSFCLSVLICRIGAHFLLSFVFHRTKTTNYGLQTRSSSSNAICPCIQTNGPLRHLRMQMYSSTPATASHSFARSVDKARGAAACRVGF